MKNIEEIYKDWCGGHHTVNSGLLVHDSAEACDFAEYYHKRRNEEEEERRSNIDDVARRYSLMRLQSHLTYEMLETWFRPDMNFFVERYIFENGKMVDKFRIKPTTCDIKKIGHIDFTKLKYENFEDAVKAMCNLILNI